MKFQWYFEGVVIDILEALGSPPFEGFVKPSRCIYLQANKPNLQGIKLKPKNKNCSLFNHRISKSC